MFYFNNRAYFNRGRDNFIDVYENITKNFKDLFK